MRSEVFARNQCLIKRKGIIIEELQRGMLTRETFIAFIEGWGRLLYKARGGEIWDGYIAQTRKSCRSTVMFQYI